MIPAALGDRGLQKQIDELEQRITLLEERSNLQQDVIRSLEQKLTVMANK